MVTLNEDCFILKCFSLGNLLMLPKGTPKKRECFSLMYYVWTLSKPVRQSLILVSEAMVFWQNLDGCYSIGQAKALLFT